LTEPVAGHALFRWYRRKRRDLPWRRTRDPYAVWLSEVMLQQTTVATVAPRWKRFLRRFPTVEALARTPEREVLAEWAGLGYYARAGNLHRAARAVVAAGAFPRTLEGWRTLPGVGPYTAAAVCSICFGVPAAVLDGNVARVLTRLHALRLDPKSSRGQARLRDLAKALLARRSPGDSNQALMELGATVCTPRAPRCPDCPLRVFCRARRLGRPETFPLARKRRASRTLQLVAGVAFRHGRLVLVEDEEMVRGHLTVPLFRVPAGQRSAKILRREWGNVAGRPAGVLEPLGRLGHSVLDRRYHVDVFTLEETASFPPLRRSQKERRRAPRAFSLPRIRLLGAGHLTRHAHGGLLLKILGLLRERTASR
jgi:A/G-specific adenine glycosylase